MGIVMNKINEENNFNFIIDLIYYYIGIEKPKNFA